MIGRARTLHQTVGVLDVGVASLVRRHVGGPHALGAVLPGVAVVFADPNAAAGNAEDDAAAVARIDANGMDSGIIVAAAHPFLPLGAGSKRTHELPTLAAGLWMKKRAPDRGAAKHALP